MKHIRQINSVGTESYTVIVTNGYGGSGEPPLESHPSVLEHPELFEIVDCEFPEQYQYGEYVSNS